MGEIRKRVSVKIQSKEYLIGCTEEDEYVQKVAYYLDRKMSQISAANTSLDSTRVAVLAALNVTDELFKAVAVLEELKHKSNSNLDLKVFDEVEKIRKEKIELKDTETSLHK